MFSIPLNPKLTPDQFDYFLNFLKKYKHLIYDVYFTSRIPPFTQDAMGDIFTENQFDLSALKKLKDFNKYTLKQNEDIYSIYSKDILEEKDDVIKQLSFENIYSIESGGLQIISNHLIDGKEFEKISKKFFNLKSNKDQSAFLYSKVNIKDGNSNKIEYFSNLQDLNFLIKNILKISNEESLEIISQSIPEKNPIIYRETILNIL